RKSRATIELMNALRLLFLSDVYKLKDSLDEAIDLLMHGKSDAYSLAIKIYEKYTERSDVKC
ncbi:MAG: hypothetical protein Q8N36_01170, partial [bacterium]|nr:hypothetical protein [bacterium]